MDERHSAGRRSASEATRGRIDVSVVIPALNGARTIGKQLDALARQETQLTWEVVVSDNGSTDGTGEVVAARAPLFPVPLRLIDSSRRQGICVARNEGVIGSRGRFILFCDCDDEADRRWVDEGWRSLQEFDLVGGRLRPTRSAPPINPHTLVGREGRWSVPGANFGVSRDAFFAVGGFDETFPPYGCDDIDFSFRLVASGRTIGPAPEMVVYFHETVGARNITRKVYRSGKAEVMVWQRHSEQFAGQTGLLHAIADLCRLPVSTTADLIHGRQPSIRALLRQAVTRSAHIAAQMPGPRRAIPDSPILLTPADDPMRA